MKLSRDTARVVLKLVIGAVLVGYVLHSKMIDFDPLKDMVLRPANLSLAIVFFVSCVLLCAVRWFLLIGAQGLSLSFGNVIQLTMIGLFFNTFMPGSVGGDLIKAWYVAGREPKQKTKAIFTVLLDRMMGLAVFFLFAAMALLFSVSLVEKKVELWVLALSVWGIMGVAAVFCIIFFIPGASNVPLFQSLVHFLSRNPLLGKVIEAALLYRQNKRPVVMGFVLSCITVTFNVFFMKFLGDSLGIPLTVLEYFFVIPIAITVSAIPILPGGIGVGQVAYFTIFQWLGVPNPELGGTLCTVVQIYTIAFNCLGALFYLNFKRKPATGALSEPLIETSATEAINHPC